MNRSVAVSLRAGRILAACGMVAGAPSSLGNDTPVMLQWFEAKWSDIERRTPDFFLAGYGASWFPPPSKAASTGSAGYDVFDRFDLGRPGATTAYGSETLFKAAVAEMHQANALVYVDAVLNHNSGRDGSVTFQTKGGWPGFWMAPSDPIVTKQPTHNWGDFHNGIAAGYYQSENPNGPRYDLYKGDLLGLCDFAQETNHVFIRHPVDASNPQNIPAGTVYNKPDALNYRCYPDRDLTGVPVNNPGTFRNQGATNFTFYPYNTGDPMQGDPVTDNGTGLLMRWTQWMLDEQNVDGFRFDAIKHAPSWFWDTFIDAVMYQRRTTPDGRKVTPFSFGECVEGYQFTYDNFIRKPNNNSGQPWRAGDSFGNRDCLDITGSGELRNVVNAGGFGSWQTVLNAHLDNADGGNDGTLGVNHVFSHDNGTTGSGNSAPAEPTLKQQAPFANAYVLMRTGAPKLYHNARGISRAGGFWPRGGINFALGVDPVANTPTSVITTLVQLHTFYARGELNVLNSTDPVNQSLNDVIIFERRTNTGSGYSGNVLVGVNDRYDSGYQERNVATAFPTGTRLLEMTGNAADATVDPSNQISSLLTVGALGRVTIRIPNNVSSAGEHNRGYVVYGPAIPSGTLTLTNVGANLPPDSAQTNRARRRIAGVPVIHAETFRIELTTTKGDTGAPNNDNADDNAVFRVDQGFADLNGNGGVDINYQNAVVPGYEQFLTVHEPLAGTTNTQGLYAQEISGAALGEGFHYISVVAFRKRDTNDAPLFREFRQVVYIDRTPPDVDLRVPAAPPTSTSFKFYADAQDRTANKVHLMANLDPSDDPIAEAVTGNLAQQEDRFAWYRTLGGLFHGFNRITVVAFEEGGNGGYTDYDVFVDLCPADFNDDGFINGDDYDQYVAAFEAGDISADFNGDGFVTGDDFDEFVVSFENGC